MFNSLGLADAWTLSEPDGEAPRLRRPEGGFRTVRCCHGLRCDPLPIRGAQWLCDMCDCPWETPIPGRPKPTENDLKLLRLMAVNQPLPDSHGKRSTASRIETLENTGLCVRRRITPAGRAVVAGVEFWP